VITTLTTSDVTGNLSPQLDSHPQVASLKSLFDQWCIPQISASYMSRESPSGVAPITELHTAIDFDNSTGITLQQIDQFDNAQVDLLSFNKVVTRTCRPCCKIDVGPSGIPGGIGRIWIDSSLSSLPWYGIRALFPQAVYAGNDIIMEATIWYAFRGRI
jgi:hypothetical protein